MGHDHGRESGLDPQAGKQQHESDRRDDIRIEHREIVDLVDRLPQYLAALGETDRGDRSDDCGYHGRNDGTGNGIADCLEDRTAFEHSLVPAQREAGELGQRLGLIEAEEDNRKPAANATTEPMQFTKDKTRPFL